MKDIIIYGLIDPRTMKLKYIGSTTNIDRRMKDHCSYKYNTSSKYAMWINDLINNNVKPLYIILTTCSYKDRLKEEYKYIAFFKSSTNNIVNTIYHRTIYIKRYIWQNTYDKTIVSLPNSVWKEKGY